MIIIEAEQKESKTVLNRKVTTKKRNKSKNENKVTR